MSQNSRIQGFSNCICLMIEGSGSRTGSGSGSISLTNGSGRPKNTWILWIEKCCLCLPPVAHNCRAADLGGEGRADGGGAAGNVLIAAGLRHHSERVIPDRSPVLSTLAKETVSRDFFKIQMFFLTCFQSAPRKDFFLSKYFTNLRRYSRCHRHRRQ